ncbi:hypothetical protein PI125_g4926 [Phytophthora idaei]|nr:hypothetical protein PI125_g4926 [Phytophthora idaei]
MFNGGVAGRKSSGESRRRLKRKMRQQRQELPPKTQDAPTKTGAAA